MKQNRCNELDCFGNEKGMCKILTSASPNCAFYKKGDPRITKGKYYPYNPLPTSTPHNYKSVNKEIKSKTLKRIDKWNEAFGDKW